MYLLIVCVIYAARARLSANEKSPIFKCHHWQYHWFATIKPLKSLYVWHRFVNESINFQSKCTILQLPFINKTLSNCSPLNEPLTIRINGKWTFCSCRRNSFGLWIFNYFSFASCNVSTRSWPERMQSRNYLFLARHLSIGGEKWRLCALPSSESE